MVRNESLRGALKFGEGIPGEMVHVAMLDRDSQHIAAGDALFDYPSKGRGIFWPDNAKVWKTDFPEAILNVAGYSRDVRIKDARWSPWHWEFILAA